MQQGWSQGLVCVLGAESGRCCCLHLDVVRAPACLIGDQDRNVEGGGGNLQESFSRGSD